MEGAGEVEGRGTRSLRALRISSAARRARLTTAGSLCAVMVARRTRGRCSERKTGRGGRVLRLGEEETRGGSVCSARAALGESAGPARGEER